MGARLVERLLGFARRRRLYMVGLFTAAHNRVFYQRFGFEFLTDVHAMCRTSPDVPDAHVAHVLSAPGPAGRKAPGPRPGHSKESPS